jgi:hypothetical protein
MYSRYVTTLLALLICIFSAQVSAQTTRPAPANFADLTRSIADSLAAGDATILSDALFSDCVIVSFESETETTPEKLAARLNGSTVITARAYAQNPTTLAADLASDFKQASDVPDAIRHEMVPEPGTTIRANITANQWIEQLLQPTKNQQICVIVLWPPAQPGTPSLRPPPRRPVFILMKGMFQNKHPRLAHILFGDPLTAIRQ